MIFGIGTDIVSVSRMEHALARHGERFAERILAAVELAEYRQSSKPAHFLAKRFAAKEAAAKAFGTGFRDGLGMGDFIIGHDGLGKPLLQFAGRAELFCRQQGVGESFLSISDEKEHAVAFVTLLKS
ncbi:MAG: holo-ACP synthase [Gammaproteobacteria bacterium]|nr:holo-ACP synthase [Gammaproteobacteria bacterium]